MRSVSLLTLIFFAVIIFGKPTNAEQVCPSPTKAKENHQESILEKQESRDKQGCPPSA